ncbi:MAG: methylated-DNA--[protein]-cysteine S-methyltransferase [Eubacteriales bacterium]|nr:methylated-DNA--[protein]-cysteine S-methyltransferase [Eubacteriales bacterium]
MKIAALRQIDYPALAEIGFAALRFRPQTMTRRLFIDWQRRAVEGELEFYGVFDGERLVAAFVVEKMLEYFERLDFSLCEDLDLAMQNQIGQMLLDFLLERLPAVRYIEVFVDARSKTAKFFDRLPFHREAPLRVHGEDCEIARYLLNSLELMAPKFLFFPFEDGLFYVRCEAQAPHALVASNFLPYDESISDPYFVALLDRYALLDASLQVSRSRAETYLSASAYQAQLQAAPLSLQLAYRDLIRYREGPVSSFQLPLRLIGSPFQLQVWAATAKIPYGETRSYGELAREIMGEDSRRYARAVGAALAANPLLLFIPCHRVIGEDRKMVGFSAAMRIKERLLALENFRAAKFSAELDPTES